MPLVNVKTFNFRFEAICDGDSLPKTVFETNGRCVVKEVAFYRDVNGSARLSNGVIAKQGEKYTVHIGFDVVDGCVVSDDTKACVNGLRCRVMKNTRRGSLSGSISNLLKSSSKKVREPIVPTVDFSSSPYIVVSDTFVAGNRLVQKQMYSLEVSSNKSSLGTVIPSGKKSYEVDSVVELRINQPEHVSFLGWDHYVDGRIIERIHKKIIEIKKLPADEKYVAIFDLCMLKVIPSRDSLGSVYPLGERPIEAGTDVAIEAMPVPGVSFLGWYHHVNGEITEILKKPECTIKKLARDEVYVAQFERYMLSVKVNDTSMGVAFPSGEWPIPLGKTVDIEAMPAPNCCFVEWRIYENGVYQGSNSKSLITITKKSLDEKYVAYFEKKKH